MLLLCGLVIRGFQFYGGYPVCYFVIRALSDMCPKPNDTENILRKKSHVEDFTESAAGLFKVLTESPDPEKRWNSITFPIDFNITSIFIKEKEIKLLLRKCFLVNSRFEQFIWLAFENKQIRLKIICLSCRIILLLVIYSRPCSSIESISTINFLSYQTTKTSLLFK